MVGIYQRHEENLTLDRHIFKELAKYPGLDWCHRGSLHHGPAISLRICLDSLRLLQQPYRQDPR